LTAGATSAAAVSVTPIPQSDNNCLQCALLLSDNIQILTSHTTHSHNVNTNNILKIYPYINSQPVIKPILLITVWQTTVEKQMTRIYEFTICCITVRMFTSMETILLEKYGHIN